VSDQQTPRGLITTSPELTISDEQLDHAIYFALLKVDEYVPEQLPRGT
jgi:hypothetical protein